MINKEPSQLAFPLDDVSKETYEREYLEWLLEYIDARDTYAYSDVCRHLHTIKYKYFVPNDDNRAADGIRLRDDFISAKYYNLTTLNIGECSVLEMIAALSDRFDRIAFGQVYSLRHLVAKELLMNLDLHHYDVNFIGGREEVNNIINVFMDRKYEKNGKGGLFPLKTPKQDQRKVEIWYQMMYYIDEKNGKKDLSN